MLNTSGCAFSISSNSTTVYGRRLGGDAWVGGREGEEVRRTGAACLYVPGPCGAAPPAQPAARRAAPDRLGQLAALVVAHVAGRRPDELGHGVALHELRHVEAHHGLLAAKVVGGQRLGQLRLAHARGACGAARGAGGGRGVRRAGAATAAAAAAAARLLPPRPWPPARRPRARRHAPEKMKEAMGRLGFLRPTRARRMAREMAVTASSCPITRPCSTSSIFTSASVSSDDTWGGRWGRGTGWVGGWAGQGRAGGAAGARRDAPAQAPPPAVPPPALPHTARQPPRAAPSRWGCRSTAPRCWQCPCSVTMGPPPSPLSISARCASLALDVMAAICDLSSISRSRRLPAFSKSWALQQAGGRRERREGWGEGWEGEVGKRAARGGKAPARRPLLASLPACCAATQAPRRHRASPTSGLAHRTAASFSLSSARSSLSSSRSLLGQLRVPQARTRDPASSIRSMACG